MSPYVLMRTPYAYPNAFSPHICRRLVCAGAEGNRVFVCACVRKRQFGCAVCACAGRATSDPSFIGHLVAYIALLRTESSRGAMCCKCAEKKGERTVRALNTVRISKHVRAELRAGGCSAHPVSGEHHDSTKRSRRRQQISQQSACREAFPGHTSTHTSGRAVA